MTVLRLASARSGLLRGLYRVGALTTPHEHRRLLHVQLRRQLVEKSPRSGLDPVSIAAVRNRIEVHRDDLLFRIVILEHDGRNPLLELGYDEFGTFRDRIVIDGRIARIQVLGQLLRDRTASPLPPLPSASVLTATRASEMKSIPEWE